ncbi:MAG: hypothetical protein R3D33_16870 [Hyphomicrobiaceae bacterium]
MTDRTQLAFGRHSVAVPRLLKRTLQTAMAVIGTALASLLVIMLNTVLTSQGGWLKGVNAWTGYIQRSDILGTMILTAVVAVAVIHWQRKPDRR